MIEKQVRSLAAAGLLLALLFSTSAHARVFNFSSEKFATYFRGSFANSMVADSPYAHSSGDDVSTDKKSQYNSSGELGILLSGERLNLRLGAELLVPQRFTDISGTNSSSTKYFDLSSLTLAIIPMLSFEYLAHRTPTSHVLLGAGVGYAFVSLQNKYTMTPAGSAALSVASFTESAQAQVPTSQVYVGYETLFTDTVTAALDLGYRYAPVASLKSSGTATAPSGAESTGSTLLNMDGTNRQINLSGFFVGLSFRFYIGL